MSVKAHYKSCLMMVLAYIEAKNKLKRMIKVKNPPTFSNLLGYFVIAGVCLVLESYNGHGRERCNRS